MKPSCIPGLPPRLALTLLTLTLLAPGAPQVGAADPLQQDFLPFAEKHCLRCHNAQQARGELDLSQYQNAQQVVTDFRRWNHIVEFIRDGAMPPEDEPQPTIDERARAADAVEAILLAEAKKLAGDPGVVLPRRLSNTEYDLSIRDLTGVDIRPTRDFPPDPAAGEGFDNTGEALGMSPSLLNKYLGAAQHVADHVVLETDGLAFASAPVTSYNERKKLTEHAIIDFYERNSVNIADYLEAAWRYHHQAAADQALTPADWAAQHRLSSKYLALVLDTLTSSEASSGYLRQLGDAFRRIPPPHASDSRPRELAELVRLVEFCRRSLGADEPPLIQSHAGNWPIRHLALRARVAKQRDQFEPRRLKSRVTLRFARLAPPADQGDASQGMTLYLRADPALGDAAGARVLVHRPLFSNSDALPQNEDQAAEHEVVTLRSVLEQHAPALAQQLAFGTHPDGRSLDPDSFVMQTPATIEIPLTGTMLRQLGGKQLLAECQLDPQDVERAVHLQPAAGPRPDHPYTTNAELLVHADSQRGKACAADAARICATFPNRFYYVDNERGLAAGFHLVDGFFRDDQPLMEKVLDDEQQRELNRLWRELHFVTQSTETLLRGFVWFERAERHVLHDSRFDFLRSEDPRLVDDEMLTRFEQQYLDKLGVRLVVGTLEPQEPSEQYDLIHGFFLEIRAGLQLYREQLKEAELAALGEMRTLAERAYRRPLSDADWTSLMALYESLRQRGQGVEAALRGVLTAVLMTPDFFLLYRESPAQPGVHPLSDHALASRLSHFLWSTLPDEPLRAAARGGQLHEQDVLLSETRRMLSDARVEAFAREFFGQWLRFRDYLHKDAINADAFPGYSEPLREAMFDEPVRFATYLILNDRPITELLGSDATFVNGILADHYGGEIAGQYRQQSTDPADWHRVTGLRAAGRGGLLGMGVILTKNSKGERTSPVKRGFWTAHHLLGQHFPPPPADVAELPTSERQATATIRELLAAHTANPRCAMCHTHFDSLGLALEGFDPIGRARSVDSAGRPIDNVASLPGGATARGTSGLIEYIERQRKDDFVRTLCRKFLGYALGRSVLLSDQPLLDEMQQALENNEYRFSVLFETVVRSRQFRMQRVGQ